MLYREDTGDLFGQWRGDLEGMRETPVLKVKNSFESISLSLTLPDNQLRRDETDPENFIRWKFFRIPATWEQTDEINMVCFYMSVFLRSSQTFYIVYVMLVK